METTAELTEKKSRFIAYAKPVQTEESAIAFINEIKSKHWDARHNVYAYILKDGNISRYSDDGEPHGTAGLPILKVLTGKCVVNVAIVVTRYFGGILLGTGGLARAYSNVAQMAIDKAGTTEMIICDNCKISCSYDQYGKILNVISDYGGKSDETVFGEAVKFKFHIPEYNFDAVNKKVSELTSGQVKPQFICKTFETQTRTE